jgi:uncharacterized protein
MGELNITLWITTICNFKCIYCYELNHEELAMSENDAKDTVIFIINYMDKMNINMCNIHFHGGEPFLYSNIVWYFIKKFKNYSEYKFTFSVTTNGTITSEEIEENLVNEISNISFSIDGPKYIFDLFRKSKNSKDYYDIIMANAKAMLKRKNDVRIRLTIVPETAGYLFENIKYFIDLGFKYISHSIDYTNKEWTEDLFNQYFHQIRKLRSYIKEFSLNNLVIDGSKNTDLLKRGKCQGGVYSLTIYPNGKIYPCTIVSGDDSYLIGNIKTGIKKDWIIELESINELCIDECQGCTLIESCFSNRCRFYNKVLTGYYQKPSGNICAVQNIMHKLHSIYI